jgi:hypothetical protein
MNEMKKIKIVKLFKDERSRRRKNKSLCCCGGFSIHNKK